MAKIYVQSVFKTAFILALYVGCCTFLMAFSFHLVKDRIAENQAQERMMLITETLPAHLNQQSPRLIPIDIPQNALIDQDKVTTGYRVILNETVVGAIFETVANGGYGGNIRLLVAVSPDLTVLGVRVLEHKETPGIGDYVATKPTIQKPRVWLNQFDNRSLDNPSETQWQVTKDRGDFDYVAGATISPRAVVKGVKNALLFATEQQEFLFRQSSSAPQEQSLQ